MHTLTNGGYWRDGTFHRIENFAERRHAVERDFSEAQALERQAARSDDIGTRLEQIASVSRSNGYQISDDMSQVIASRYAAMAASSEFKDLGAPSLTSTTPSPHQRDVRNMIVARILEDYAAGGLSSAESALQDPVKAMGPVQGANPVAAPAHPTASHPPLGHLHTKSGDRTSQQDTLQPHAAPGDDQARDAIAQGAQDVKGQDRNLVDHFNESKRKRETEDTKIKRDLDQ